MANPRPRTVHDFFGFAEGLYEVEYCARCEAEHSAKVAEVLAVAGIPVEFEGQRGFDVGCWSPLCLIFPAADVPVVQVSLHGSRDAQFHVRIGKALGALRDIGYLIVGTGGVTWNLLDLDYGGGEPPAAAVAVDRWVKDVVSREENKPQWLAAADADVAWEARSQKLARIFDHRVDIAEAARRAHPSPDSFLPLIVASGPQPPSTLLKNVSSAAAADPLLIETEPVVHRKFG
jgi:4,5-DOPA dioxygenase extradiol